MSADAGASPAEFASAEGRAGHPAAALPHPTRACSGRADWTGPWRLVDMHCHLDRMENGMDVASALAAMGIAAFCTTVTPGETPAARELFSPFPNVRVGAGLHPWWLDGNSLLVEQATALSAGSDFVGEIGLDFSPAHAATRGAQIEAFKAIVSACEAHPRPGRILSIHAVRAANQVLDILETHGMAGGATCIFHWFSGTSADFTRLRSAGCYISVNERMLATKRGREYARQTPADHLLLETDAPAVLDTPSSARELETSLQNTLRKLAAIRGANVQELAERIAQTSSVLLGL